MKVLFLDIDGVLNSEDWALAKYKAGVTGALQKEFDTDAVKRLNTIVEKTGAKIVISSSWRIAHSLEYIFNMMKKFGFVGEVIDRTPSVRGFKYARGFQIQEWLDEHPEVTHFAILDDDSDMEHLKPKLVQTSWSKGLLDEHIEKVAEHFK